MKAIGGYFELELDKKGEYHADAICLNTARNAFEYIIIANKYNKVYLPFFTCDVLLEPLKKHNVDIVFYNIDEAFEPVFDFSEIQENEAFLYTNYFGLKDGFIEVLSTTCKNLIIDNSQSFFSKPTAKIASFYSCRKFFGVPDGAYLYSNRSIDFELTRDFSADRCSHLLIRSDVSAEQGYLEFTANDEKLCHQPIKLMSALTKSILSAVDYEKCAKVRKENFNHLHKELSKSNRLIFDMSSIGVPMTYPFWCEDMKLKNELLNHKIYTPSYWPNVLEWCPVPSLEYKMAAEIIYLPIDQRYGVEEINIILKIIK